MSTPVPTPAERAAAISRRGYVAYGAPLCTDAAPALTDKQRAARASFDLDAAMAALPPAGPSFTRSGAAGVRPRPDIVAIIPDDLLREFARETLGAVRCSAQYLGALRIVLGNQAKAERLGFVLELNQRNDFASPKVMRTIIGQMQTAGISWSHPVWLGPRPNFEALPHVTPHPH